MLRLACLITLLAAPAAAQNVECYPRDALVAGLAEQYGEARRGWGLMSTGQVMEVWASEETGTWTVTMSLPNGLICPIASGHDYEVLDDPLPPGL